MWRKVIFCFIEFCQYFYYLFAFLGLFHGFIFVLYGICVIANSDQGLVGGKRTNKRGRIPDEQRLMRKILHNYDTASRPVYNASHCVTVKYGLTLIQIADMVKKAPNFG